MQIRVLRKSPKAWGRKGFPARKKDPEKKEISNMTFRRPHGLDERGMKK